MASPQDQRRVLAASDEQSTVPCAGAHSPRSDPPVLLVANDMRYDEQTIWMAGTKGWYPAEPPTASGTTVPNSQRQTAVGMATSCMWLPTGPHRDSAIPFLRCCGQFKNRSAAHANFHLGTSGSTDVQSTARNLALSDAPIRQSEQLGDVGKRRASPGNWLLLLFPTNMMAVLAPVNQRARKP